METRDCCKHIKYSATKTQTRKTITCINKQWKKPWSPRSTKQFALIWNICLFAFVVYFNNFRCRFASSFENCAASLPLSLHHRHETTLVGANKVFHIANFHPICERRKKNDNERVKCEWKQKLLAHQKQEQDHKRESKWKQEPEREKKCEQKRKKKWWERDGENNSLPLLLHLRQHYGETTRSRHQQNPLCKHKRKHG